MSQYKAGDLAMVRPRNRPEAEPTLAKFYSDREIWGDEPDPADVTEYWCYFGTDLFDRPDDVEVVTRVVAIPVAEKSGGTVTKA